MLPRMNRRLLAPALLALLGSLTACGDDESEPPAQRWEILEDSQPGALLSVWGTSANDVWIVGADARDGTGPLVFHHDGESLTRVETGQTQGSLWWVFGFSDGPVFMGGEGGVILRYEEGEFTPTETPGTQTVFGIWGASPNDLWAVGGESDTSGGFAWRNDGSDTWAAEPTVSSTIAAGAAIWKAYGRSADDVWLVGSGVSLYWDGEELTEGDTGVGASLFTVHASEQRFAAVGGLATGVIVENSGSGWTNVTPQSAPSGLSGVALSGADGGYAVGVFGTVLARSADGWAEEILDVDVDQNLHGVWIDPDGGVWAAGGKTSAFPPTDGVLIRRRPATESSGI